MTNKKILLLLLLVSIVFFALRLPAVNHIYHQDEHRWAMIVDGSDPSPGPHPPMMRTVLKITATIVGFYNLRFGPLLFSFFNILLIYIVSRKISDNKVIPLISVILFAVNIYSIIASLQVDIDGAILPFFGLLAYYAYLKLNKKWIPILGLAVLGGFFTKLSFILFIGAGFLDLIYRGKGKTAILNFLKLYKFWIVSLIVAVLFYDYRFPGVIDYAQNFKSFNFESRAYFDLGFKVMKSLVWLSPLLFVPVIAGLFIENIFKKYRFWYFYLFLNLIFYLVIFDFSKLTVERYFMFLIVPSVLISAEVIYLGYKNLPRPPYKLIASGIGMFIFLTTILMLDHKIIPLDPKSEYLNQLKSFNLNFLIPFSGGSGPNGFYFSASFIFLAWLTSGLFMFLSLYFKSRKSFFITLFLIFGFGYNLLFATTFLTGFPYGSPALISKKAVDYIVKNPDINSVITYYDIGAYELKKNNKYGGRFYTAPTRDYSQKISTYRGQYLIVDFPGIDKTGRYWPHIAKCPILSSFEDRKVKAYIFNCQ